MRERLRATFDEVAELYDRARPPYPEELFDDLAARIPAGGRVVEIGPGTGQATLPLAERGFSIVAVELGAELAEVARRKLARFPNVEIVTEDFERWQPQHAEFDAVVVFTAFHWLDPAVQYVKPAQLLRRGGVLAIVEVGHVRVEGGDPFWLEVQEDYDAVVPDPANAPPPFADEVVDLQGEFEGIGAFADVDVRRYGWEVTYSADEYLDVLRTYSPNIARDPATTARLLGRIRARIEARPDPRVTKHYLALLIVGRAR